MDNETIYTKFIITKEYTDYLAEKDEIMGKLITVIGEVENQYIPDPFIALINSIVYQALSFKACTTIWNKFYSFVGELTPQNIMKFTDLELRNCGLSTSKVAYIKNVSKAFLKKTIPLDFDVMSNQEVIKQLTSIKGIGKWTAQMFLTFSLYRKDIISYSDLAIRRGLEWLYQLDHELTLTEFYDFEKKYSPYNTIASLYIWEITLRDLFKHKSINEMQ